MSTINDLKEKLQAGTVKFKYKKVTDGSERTATGTLNEDILKDKWTPKDPAVRFTPAPVNVIRYFDLDKNAWRSLREENFIEFINE